MGKTENLENIAKFALHEPRYRAVPAGKVRPRGWLLEQLRIQAEGLSGNLDLVWPDIRDSRWIGGEREGWERVPYWLDGFIPLAWLLGDEALQQRAKRYMDHILAAQGEDGWLCPDDGTPRQHYDMWAHLLILKVMVLYEEFTGDERIEPAVRQALLVLGRHINGTSLFNWGQSRWFEGLIAIWWLYERKPEPWLLELALKLRSQGLDWIGLFEQWPYRQAEGAGVWSYMSHVVNNAMMLKSGPLLWRLTGKEEHLAAAEHMVKLLDAHHGMVTGVFSGDECLAGTSPIQGTELCAVAEYMYSLEHLLALTGKAHWGDRLERIAYNALPATFSPDMWTHQYDQQVNQVACVREERPVFHTNGGESNLFGLEPNFGCCTANLSQPWPKLALAVFMRHEAGFAVGVYAPCEAELDYKGVSVRLALDTEYPFRDTLHFTVDVAEGSEFTLALRIPEWTEAAELAIGEERVRIRESGFYNLHRVWPAGRTAFTLQLPMQAAVVSRPGGLAAVTRGPLVYALPIMERWVRINEGLEGHEPPHCDYELHPAGAWNYGLCEQTMFRYEERPFVSRPFSPDNAPSRLLVYGRKVDWPLVQGSAAPLPRLDWVGEEVEELALIPYGCTNLRLTEMPLVPAAGQGSTVD